MKTSLFRLTFLHQLPWCIWMTKISSEFSTSPLRYWNFLFVASSLFRITFPVTSGGGGKKRKKAEEEKETEKKELVVEPHVIPNRGPYPYNQPKRWVSREPFCFISNDVQSISKISKNNVTIIYMNKWLTCGYNYVFNLVCGSVSSENIRYGLTFQTVCSARLFYTWAWILLLLLLLQNNIKCTKICI